MRNLNCADCCLDAGVHHRPGGRCPEMDFVYFRRAMDKLISEVK